MQDRQKSHRVIRDGASGVTPRRLRRPKRKTKVSSKRKTSSMTPMRFRSVCFLLFASFANLGFAPPVLAEEVMMEKSQSGVPLSRRSEAPRCAIEGIGVGGYDLVSYHEDGPQLGSSAHQARHDGLAYHFVSAEHRDRFQANPERYLPRYGGWCALTIALGRLVCPDFTNYKIEGGALLLFETIGFTNGLSLWNSDPMRFRSQADDNYAKVRSE